MLPSLRLWAQQTAVPAAARLEQLVKLRADVLGTVYNPDSLRTGSKVLKARLRGPAMLRYYGDRFSSFRGLNNAIPGLELRDLVEETRLLDIETLRKRGKVKPKKGQGRRASMKKR
ncbi:mitochondral 37S ribosomal protein S27 [Rhodotorula kratochvilovae]